MEINLTTIVGTLFISSTAAMGIGYAQYISDNNRLPDRIVDKALTTAFNDNINDMPTYLYEHGLSLAQSKRGPECRNRYLNAEDLNTAQKKTMFKACVKTPL